MEVILLSDVEKVGLRGEVVQVARGFARNYLIPRRLAEAATPGRVAEIKRREATRADQEARTFEQAQEIAETLGRAELRFEVKAGPTGSLFGSVTPTVDRRKIELADPIKRTGRYEVPIDLFTDVRVEVKMAVVPEGGELPPAELEAVEPEPEGEPEADSQPTEIPE